jgi:hypothetical protein
LRLNIVNTCSSSYLYFEFATIACAEPAAIEETLWFNIFPVTELPDFIYVADTDYSQARDIYNEIDSQLLDIVNDVREAGVSISKDG